MELLELVGPSLVSGQGIFDWLDNAISEARTLVTAIAVVVGVVVGFMIIVKNPGVGRAIVGVVVGGFIAGIPFLINLVADLFRGELESSGAVDIAIALYDLSPALIALS